CQAPKTPPPKRPRSKSEPTGGSGLRPSAWLGARAFPQASRPLFLLGTPPVLAPRLHKSSATARASACGAAEAVGRRRNPRVRERLELVPVPDRTRAGAEGNLEHLVEVAVVKTSVISHRDEASAHDSRQRGGIEVVHEERRVLRLSTLPGEIRSKASNRHVGKREEPVKGNAESMAELVAVLRLELGFRRRKRRAHRVVDEVEGELGSR